MTRTRLPFVLIGGRAINQKQLLIEQISSYFLLAAAAYLPFPPLAADAWISRAGKSGLWLLAAQTALTALLCLVGEKGQGQNRQVMLV